MTDTRRRLPSIERLLADPGVARLLAHAPRSAVVAAARDAVASARTGRSGPPEDWASEIADRLRLGLAHSLAPVLNATGVVLHTNLGRAPLAPSAVRAVADVAAGYSSLEIDLPSGARGSRGEHGRARLVRLTGAEDALVVNNAAGALVLALNALAGGTDVVISRGELIEIGGSFRIPEIIARAGVRLREVGTTNRTHLRDYRDALDGGGAVLLVHRSNFAQRGFVATPSPEEVVALAREAGVPLIHDIGSGLLADLAPYGLASEPTVRAAVAAGADIVLFSGDKLLGGPQAGILVGGAKAIERSRRNPLARALRADKMTLAALDATLALYDDPETARREIPVLAMLTESAESIAHRAAALAAACPRALAPVLVPGSSAVGGGAFPDADLPTTLVQLDPGPLGPDALALRLRLGDPPVVARVAEGRVLLDPRTLSAESCTAVADALTRALDAE
jgi:L-seryl-tRNA(Ser) seleniumtransferase